MPDAMRRRGASAFGAPLLIFFSPYLNRSIEILSQPLNRDDEWNRNRETGSDIWGVVYFRVWLSTRCNRGTVSFELTTRGMYGYPSILFLSATRGKRTKASKRIMYCVESEWICTRNSVNPKTDPQNIVNIVVRSFPR